MKYGKPAVKEIVGRFLLGALFGGLIGMRLFEAELYPVMSASATFGCLALIFSGKAWTMAAVILNFVLLRRPGI
jgi:hypothetical protein